MEKEKSYINIVIVSLDDKFSKNVANDLASKLDMFLADCKDLIEYDLMNHIRFAIFSWPETQEDTVNIQALENNVNLYMDKKLGA